MVGWDDDAFHSQVICPSEDSESILCSNLHLMVCGNKDNKELCFGPNNNFTV